jgi:hypothetical protein
MRFGTGLSIDPPMTQTAQLQRPIADQFLAGARACLPVVISVAA